MRVVMSGPLPSGDMEVLAMVIVVMVSLEGGARRELVDDALCRLGRGERRKRRTAAANDGGGLGDFGGAVGGSAGSWNCKRVGEREKHRATAGRRRRLSASLHQAMMMVEYLAVKS